MRLPTTTILTAALLTLAGDSLFAQNYLTKKGQLTQPLKVAELQGGFVGFTGVQYTIAPDGSWISETILNQKLTPKSKGQLTEQDLAKLGAILAKYGLVELPATTDRRPGANPYSLTFEFGAKKATLSVRSPPKVDPRMPTGTVESRFAGIWEGVVGMLKAGTPTKEETE